ncbi:hypothetical protein LEMLEM_LOCUS25786 [Lemmus lemmus]
MSWCRLSRLLKPALLCGALAAPGLAGTMVGTPGDLGDCGHSGRVSDLAGAGSGLGHRVQGLLARLGDTREGKRTPVGIPRAEGWVRLGGGTGVGATIAGSDLVPRPARPGASQSAAPWLPALCPRAALGTQSGRVWAARSPATRDAAGSVAGPGEAGDGVNLDPEILGSAGALGGGGGGGKLESAAAGGRALAGRIGLPGLYCGSLVRAEAAPSSWACAHPVMIGAVRAPCTNSQPRTSTGK